MATPQPSTLRIGQRYRSYRLNGPYDTLVIGSGIGGLATAALQRNLASASQSSSSTTQPEAPPTATSARATVDVGVHYVGDMGSNTTVRRLMDFLTQGRWTGRRWTRTTTDSSSATKIYDAVAGREAFRDNLVGHFPREAAAIDRYLELSAKCRAACERSRSNAPPAWAATLVGPWLRRRLPYGMGRTTWEVLSELTEEPRTDRSPDRSMGRPGVAAKTLIVRHPSADCQPLPARWLLSRGRRMAHRRRDPSAHPRLRRGEGAACRRREIITMAGCAACACPTDTRSRRHAWSPTPEQSTRLRGCCRPRWRKATATTDCWRG